MVFPWSDRQYVLFTDSATGMADTPGGLGAILTQVDNDSKFYVIPFAPRQLKDHEKITHLSYWRLPQQSGAWTILMNPYGVNN
jgi:hypothetical protein